MAEGQAGSHWAKGGGPGGWRGCGKKFHRWRRGRRLTGRGPHLPLSGVRPFGPLPCWGNDRPSFASTSHPGPKMVLAPPHGMLPSCAAPWWWHRVVLACALVLTPGHDLPPSQTSLLPTYIRPQGWLLGLALLGSGFRDDACAAKSGTRQASEVKPRLGFRDEGEGAGNEGQ